MTGNLTTASESVSLTYRNFESKKNGHLSLESQRDYDYKQSNNEESTTEQTNLLQEDSTREITTKANVSGQKVSFREVPRGRKALILVACLLLHFILGGAVVTLGVIYVDLIRAFDAPHSQAALIQSIFMGANIAGGVLFTGVLQKYGTGIPVIIASLIAGLAFLAGAFAPNVPTLIALIGVIGGLSMGIHFLSAFVTVGWTFCENRKTALALLTLGWSFGQILFPYISEYLVEYFGWNGSFVILGGIILNCVPCGLFLYKSKKYFLVIKPPARTVRETVNDCLQDYLFVIFLLASFFYASMASVETWFIADLVVVRGFDRSIGSFLLSLLGIFGFIGRIIGALFLKIFTRIEALVHVSYSIMIWGVAHFLTGYFTELWGLILAVVLRGITEGITFAVMPGSQIELRGNERFSQTVAICNLIGGVSSILGGLVGGVTVDMTGGYEFIFTLAAVIFQLCGVFIIIVWLLNKRKIRQTASSGTKYTIPDEENTMKQNL